MYQTMILKRKKYDIGGIYHIRGIFVNDFSVGVLPIILVFYYGIDSIEKRWKNIILLKKMHYKNRY